MNNLGGRLPCNGIVEAVLHHGIKVFRRRRIAVIVDAALGIDISNLLPDPAFARPDRAHPLEQFAEVVLSEHFRSVLQPVVIQDKAFPDVLVENLRGPLAEAGSPH